MLKDVLGLLSLKGRSRLTDEKMDKQDKMIQLLEELVKWTKVESIQKVEAVLHGTLKDEKDIRAYHFSDGRGSLEVAKAAGFKSHPPVLELWKKWYRLGLVEPLSVRGGTRYKRVFSLEDLGIEVPSLEVSSESVADEEKGDGE